MPPASNAAATPMASGRLERNTAPTSATDTVPPPSSVRPMAIDSGMPSSTMPTVRLRAAVASAPLGSRVVAGGVLGLLDRFLGVFALGAPVEPGGEPVVPDRADEQTDPGGRASGGGVGGLAPGRW